MKIFELSRPDHKDVEQILSNYGYEQIGVGYYAQVYSRPNDNYVLKIVSPKDRAYFAFWKFCQSNKDDIHLPRFKGKYMRVTKDYCAVRMEKLEIVPVDDKHARDCIIMKIILDFYERGEELPEYHPDMRSFKLKPWAMEHPSIDATLKKMAPLAKIYSNDLSDFNIMMRKNGDYVFTDPFG